MAAHSKMIFSKLLTVTDINKRLAVPSAILATFHWRPYHHISVFIRYKTLANSLHNPKEGVQETRILSLVQGEDGCSYYRVKVGREVHFFGIPEDAAEAYPQIITRNRQGLLRQPTTQYGAELALTLAPTNVERNTKIGSMARL
ncbi:hypothetical protein GOBAR_DD27885 [Gossypium barbadense]|nr:hypothetical protein GOBAR_DD27885 [Gossypium barbadense]